MAGPSRAPLRAAPMHTARAPQKRERLRRLLDEAAWAGLGRGDVPLPLRLVRALSFPFLQLLQCFTGFGVKPSKSGGQ